MSGFRTPPRRLAYGPLAILLPALACSGQITDHGTDMPGGGQPTGSGPSTGGAQTEAFAAACAASKGALNAGLTPMRRLTRDQFNNAVHDLLGSTGTPADALATDEQI